jgi:hypothetical protein
LRRTWPNSERFNHQFVDGNKKKFWYFKFKMITQSENLLQKKMNKAIVKTVFLGLKSKFSWSNHPENPQIIQLKETFYN